MAKGPRVRQGEGGGGTQHLTQPRVPSLLSAVGGVLGRCDASPEATRSREGELPSPKVNAYGVGGEAAHPASLAENDLLRLTSTPLSLPPTPTHGRIRLDHMEMAPKTACHAVSRLNDWRWFDRRALGQTRWR